MRKLVDKYFITSVGDKAADRLGDAFFEAGEFDSAERCWRMIVEDYPDTGLSPTLLQTKRGIAVRGPGNGQSSKLCASSFTNDSPGRSCESAGRTRRRRRYSMTSPNAPAANEPSATTAGVKPSTMIESGANSTPMALPATDTPVWQIPLMDQASSDRVSQQLSQIGWGGMASELTEILPSTAADDKRVYVNWMGSVFALDLITGKMLWRTNRFFDFGQNVQQVVMQGQSTGLSDGNIEVVGDRLLAIKAQQPDMRRAQMTSTRLIALAADTGKIIWTSERQGNKSLANWSFVGKPLVDGDAMYVWPVCPTIAGDEPDVHGCCRWRSAVARGTGERNGKPGFQGTCPLRGSVAASA